MNVRLVVGKPFNIAGCMEIYHVLEDMEVLD